MNRLLAPGIGLVVSLLLSVEAVALTPSVMKLLGRAPITDAGDNVGTVLAVNESWVIAGAPFDGEGGVDAGAVFVYSAVTGRFVRKLRPLDLVANDQFGYTVALCGNQALIGAYNKDSTTGKAYLYDVSKGTPLREFTPPAGTPGDAFGWGVALSSKYAAIGAYGENSNDGALYIYDLRFADPPVRLEPPALGYGGYFGESVALVGDVVVTGATGSDELASNAGAAFVFNVATETLIHTLLVTDPEADDYLGSSLSVSGGKVLVGAAGAESEGAAYLFDLETGTLLSKLKPFELVGGDNFGFSVALNGNLALVGAYHADALGANSGAAYLMDVTTGDVVRKLLAPDGTVGDLFGYGVALANGVAVVGAVHDDDLGGESGAAYLFKGITGPLPMQSLAKVGDFAPGVADADFKTFGTPLVNQQGEVLFNAGLTGPGSNKNKDTGVWSTIANEQSLDLLMKSRDDLSNLGPSFNGVKVTSVKSPVMDRDDLGLFQAALTGTGVTANNNAALFKDDGTTLQLLLRTSAPVADGNISGPTWNGAKVKSLLQVAHARNEDFVLASCNLQSGADGVNGTNDSGILVLDHTGQIQNTHYREGQPSPGGGTYGQFVGKVGAAELTYFAFRAASIPGPGQAPKSGVYFGRYISSGGRLGQQGEAPPALGGAQYSAFTGEALQDGQTLWMATVKGGGATAQSNQTLWHESNGLVLRTGDVIDPLLGLSVTRIEKVWPVGGTRAVIQVLLKGNGVNGTNNRALFLWWNSGEQVFQKLLRTGDVVEGCAPAKVGVIQQVAVDPSSGQYAVLASLTGVSAATNQVLLKGDSAAGNDTATRRVLRLPYVALRKGGAYQSAGGQSTSIKSITMANTTDTDGFGGKGTGQTISGNGALVVTVQFNNNAAELLLGEF